MPPAMARAAVLTGPRTVEVREVQVAAPTPGEVQVAILFTGISAGTEMNVMAGVSHSCNLAQRLKAQSLIVLAGESRTGVGRGIQRDALTEALRRAAPVASRHGIRLLLEPLNTRVDHPGYFLDSTTEAMEVVRDVDHPAVRLLYDVYHSIVMGEEPRSVLEGSGDLVGHVHIADVPGRHEPGTGTIDWPQQLAALRSAGYSGWLGLEYLPTGDTRSSLAFIRGVVDQAG